MTADQANAEAMRRWGPLGGAAAHRKPGKRTTYSVGLGGVKPIPLGKGSSFEDAFKDAEAKGFTPAEVAKSIGIAARRMRWKRFKQAFRSLFRW